MADYPPYMFAYGNLTKILKKIKDAKTPERFSHDYLESVLGFKGGGARPFIPLAKRIGLLNTDGTPTDLYNRFRNPAQSESAMAEMIRRGYPDVYKRNEYAHAMSKPDLQGLLTELTGLDNSSETLKAITNTFEALKTFANFELSASPPAAKDPAEEPRQNGGEFSPRREDVPLEGQLRFSHNIFINLPDTTDVEVFNAIFKSMKENLLS